MATFASAEDIAGRLGRDLTTAEATQTDTLLELATLAIAEAVQQDQDWADALSPVPSTLRLICIELVVRALLNPTGAVSTSETLGAYSHSERYDITGAGGMELTEPEGRRIRRAVFGANSASVRVGSIVDDPFVHRHYQSIYLDGDESES